MPRAPRRELVSRLTGSIAPALVPRLCDAIRRSKLNPSSTIEPLIGSPAPEFSPADRTRKNARVMLIDAVLAALLLGLALKSFDPKKKQIRPPLKQGRPKDLATKVAVIELRRVFRSVYRGARRGCKSREVDFIYNCLSATGIYLSRESFERKIRNPEFSPPHPSDRDLQIDQIASASERSRGHWKEWPSDANGWPIKRD